MIINDHLRSYQRLAPHMRATMAMLGAQINSSSFTFPCDYLTVDLDGGDLKLDLSEPIPQIMTSRFATVFNLGTLEHVWDAHQAYVNAASMVEIGGHFLGQIPVAGWENHGIHVTGWLAIMSFFEINGFRIVERWMTTANGAETPVEVKRNAGKSMLFWLVAQRVATTPVGWNKPSQVYRDGVKP